MEYFTIITQEVLEKTRAIHAIDRELHPFCGIALLFLGKALVDRKNKLLSRTQKSQWKKLSRVTALHRECYAITRRAKLGNISKGISLGTLSELAQREFSDYKIIVYATKFWGGKALFFFF